MEPATFIQGFSLLILGALTSTLFASGYYLEGILLTVIGLAIFSYLARGKVDSFEERLRDKPVY